MSRCTTVVPSVLNGEKTSNGKKTPNGEKTPRRRKVTELSKSPETSRSGEVIILSPSQAAEILGVNSIAECRQPHVELAMELALRFLGFGLLGARPLLFVTQVRKEVHIHGVYGSNSGATAFSIPISDSGVSVEDAHGKVPDRLRESLLHHFSALSLGHSDNQLQSRLIEAAFQAVTEAAPPLETPDEGAEAPRCVINPQRVRITMCGEDWKRPRIKRVSSNGIFVSAAREYSGVIERTRPEDQIHARPHAAPSPRSIRRIVDRALNLLLRSCNGAGAGLILHHDVITKELIAFAQELIPPLQRGFLCQDPEMCRVRALEKAEEVAAEIVKTVPKIAEVVNLDAIAGYRNDPSVHSPAEFAMVSPGLRTIAIQRLAHELYRAEAKILGRMLTELAHSRYGIDIHPGASIGHSFVIDHGTGTVIGQTAVIGCNCTIYQGVTLGAYCFPRDVHGNLVDRGDEKQRHPTLSDHVTVYANATILGGETVIGRYSTVGANVRLTRSVPPESVVTIELNPPVIEPRKDSAAK